MPMQIRDQQKVLGRSEMRGEQVEILASTAPDARQWHPEGSLKVRAQPGSAQQSLHQQLQDSVADVLRHSSCTMTELGQIQEMKG